MSEPYDDPGVSAGAPTGAVCDGCTPTLCGLFTETWRCPPAQVARMRAQAIRDHGARELRRRVDLALSRGGGAA